MGGDSPTDEERRDQRYLTALRTARAAGDTSGERRAMGQLLHPYWFQCRSIARGRIGGVANPLSDAEDIAQEVMRRLAVALDKTTEFDSPFHAVVHTNLGWAIADYWRRQAGRQVVPSDPADLPELVAEDGPSELAESENFDRQLRGLPKYDRELLRDRILADKSSAEIAAARGKTEGAINTALHRAFKKLRENLRVDVRESTGSAD